MGLEPTTGGLREARSGAPGALAAQMTRVIAPMALAALELSGNPVHEPVHARGPCARHPATVRNVTPGTASTPASPAVIEPTVLQCSAPNHTIQPLTCANAAVQHPRHQRCPLYVRAHGHKGGPAHGQPRTLSAEPPDLRKPAGRTLCPQAHPASANVRRGNAEEPLTSGGYHPAPGIPGLRTVIPAPVIRAPVTTMIAAPGAPLLAAEACREEVKNPRHGPGTIRRHPIPAHLKQMAHRVTCQASTTATCRPSW